MLVFVGLAASSREATLRSVKHFWPVVAPVPYSGIGGHLHLAGIVGVQKIEGWPQIPAAVVDA
jgi:hypothetical protein